MVRGGGAEEATHFQPIRKCSNEREPMTRTSPRTFSTGILTSSNWMVVVLEACRQGQERNKVRNHHGKHWVLLGAYEVPACPFTAAPHPNAQLVLRLAGGDARPLSLLHPVHTAK